MLYFVNYIQELYFIKQKKCILRVNGNICDQKNYI